MGSLSQAELGSNAPRSLWRLTQFFYFSETLGRGPSLH